MKGPQLRVWREANSLSQQKASERLGRSLRTYIRYETGERPIPEDVAAIVMATPNVNAPSVELAPEIQPGETPWTHPRLYRRHPRKLAWERINPGTPLLPDTYVQSHPQTMQQLEQGKNPLDLSDAWEEDAD